MPKHTYIPNPCALFEDDNELDEAPIAGHRRRNTPYGHYHSVKVRAKKDALSDQKAELEGKVLDTATRCVKLLDETEDIAITAAKELVSQGQQIQNTHRHLDEINANLDRSQKKINGIKSVFSGLSKYFSKKDKKDLLLFREKKLGEDLNNSLRHSQSEPSLSKLHIYDHSSNYSSNQNFTKNSENNLDDKLEIFYGEMAHKIGNLKTIGTLIGQEVNNQNESLDLLSEKLTSVDIRLHHQTDEIKDLL